MSCNGVLPENRLRCPLCSLVFTDPVTTPCGHNFCHSCLEAAWSQSDCQCPTCQRSFSPRPEMVVNVAFKELADTFRSVVVPQATLTQATPPQDGAGPGEVPCAVCLAGGLQVAASRSCLVCLTSYCALHLEPHQQVAALRLHKLMAPVADLRTRLCAKHEQLLELFCREEREPVCRFCIETEHKEHTAVSVEQESEDRKAEITNIEAQFKNLIEQRLEKEQEISNSLQKRKKSAEKELGHSEELFSSLMELLKEHQQEVTDAVVADSEKAEARAEDLSRTLQEEVQELRTRTRELEELRQSEDHLHVIQRLPLVSSSPVSRDWSELSLASRPCVGTLTSALCKLQDTVDKHVDSLKSQEMKTVQKYAVDVVLDPHTAHPNIVLSPDGKQAGRGELLHVVPDNPQRFDPVICVLATRGFSSGRFYFQVFVGSKTFWDLGVVLESVNRKGMITSKPENGFWTVRLRDGDEYRALDSPSVLLKPRAPPKTVGVYVDYEHGAVRFYDVDAKVLIYAFSGCSFSQRLFPFFSPGVCDGGKNVAPLILMPVKPERAA
ncbi:unnamed protein product [Knipowitschia caucasica]|uniref:Uncharacterized protein n=1 Tax=Knipowitschia caucasica TaxID=637954 RepID=A0AAV2KIR1_KNICA